MKNESQTAPTLQECLEWLNGIIQFEDSEIRKTRLTTIRAALAAGAACAEACKHVDENTSIANEMQDIRITEINIRCYEALTQATASGLIAGDK